MELVLNPALILIKIESKRGGDHKELKIFLSNRLIPSRFNQELRTKENTSFFYKRISARNVGRPFDDKRRAVDHVKPKGSWPTTRSTIAFHLSSMMKIYGFWAIQSHETMRIVAHDAVHDLLQREPSDEDRTLLMHPRITHDHRTGPTPSMLFARLMKMGPSRCVHASPR